MNRSTLYRIISVVTMVVAMVVLAGNAQAETLIGGATRNGDFNATTNGTGGTFAETVAWYNLGTAGQTKECTLNNNQYDGTRNAVIGEKTDRLHAQDTEYTIQTKDKYSVSYVWREDGNNSTGWHDDYDQLNVRLYVTDNNSITGAQTQVANLLSGLSTSNNTYQSYSGETLPVVDSGVVGKRLFVAIDTQDGNGATNGYARVDNFVLSVNDDNVIRNPGFEEDESGDLPTDWTLVKGDKVREYSLGITPHSGAKQFQLQNDDTILSQEVTISEPGFYLLSMWIANRDDTNHHLNTVASDEVKFELLDSDGDPVTPSKSVSADYDAPRGVYVEWTRTFAKLPIGDYTVKLSTGDGSDAAQGMVDDFSLTSFEPDGFFFIIR